MYRPLVYMGMSKLGTSVDAYENKNGLKKMWSPDEQ